MKLFYERILISCTILALIGIAVIIFLSLRKTEITNDTTGRVFQTNKVLYTSEKVLELVSENNANTEMYLLTANKTYLSGSEKSVIDIFQGIQALKTIKITGSYLHMVDSLEALLNKQQAMAGELTGASALNRNKNRFSPAGEPTTRMLFNQIHRQINLIQDHAKKQLGEREFMNMAMIDQINLALVILLGFILILLVAGLIVLRKSVHARLKQEGENRYLAELVGNVQDAVISTDADLKIRSWNAGAETMYGWKAAEVTGKNIEMLLHTTKDAGNNVAQHNSVYAGYFTSELLHRTKTGEVIYVLVNASPLHDAKGKVVGSVSVNKDISNLKKMEQELVRVNTELREKVNTQHTQLVNIFERITDAFIALDRQYNITYINHHASEIIGYGSGEVLGKNIWGLFRDTTIHTQEHDFYKAVHLSMEEQVYVCAEIYHQPFGKWFENHIYPAPEGVSVFFRDITERKLDTDAIRISNERYNLISKATNDCIWDWDLITNKVERQDKKLETIYGYPAWLPEEVDANWKKYAHPDDWARVTKRRETIFSDRNENFWEDEYRFLKADGSYGYVKDRGYIIRGNDGQPIRMIGASNDISERRKADAALQNSELRFRSLIEKGSEIIAMHDADGQVIYLSPSVTKLLGYKPEEMIGRSAFDKVHPDDINRIKKLLAGIIAKPNASVSAQWRQQHINGNWRWMEGVATNLLHDPAVKAVVHNFRDITEKKEVENTIILEKELSESIINSLPGIFYLFDDTGKFLRWNINFETISGYNSKEIAAMHPVDFFGEDEKSLIAEKIAEVFTNGTAETEAHFITKSKQKIPFYFNGKMVHFEGRLCLTGTGIDISERKKDETRLKLLESVITNTTDSVIITEAYPIDGDGPRIVYVNEAFTIMSGYTAAELIGKTPRILQGPKTDRKLLDELKAALTAWQPFKTEIINYKKNGEAFWVNMSIAPVADKTGWFTHWIAIENDVSERKKAEEDLREKNTELHSLSSYLQNIREEERKYLAREVHDQLGQLASALKIDIDWLRLKTDSTDTNAQKRVEHAEKIINILISSTRKIAANLRPSILDDFGLNAALQWHCNEFENLNDIHTVFETTIHDAELPVEYKTELFRITQESLTNVMRHSQARNVKIKLSEDEKNIYLVITDDGKGFDNSGNKNTLGLIGLRERAASLHGTLQLITGLGKGTTVMAGIPKKKR